MGKLTRGGLLVAVGVLALLAGVFAGGLVHDGAATPEAAAAPSRAAIAARPAPAVAAAPVIADGACGAAMDAIRALQRAYPSGSMLPEVADEEFTADLGRLDEACAATPQLAVQFRSRELTAWLTYLPPTTTDVNAGIATGGARAG